MSKTAVVDRISSVMGQTKADSSKSVDAVFGAVRDLATSGQKVVIRGFGTFEMRTRAARTGRNPRTGEPTQIPAKTRIVFKAS